MSNNNEKIVKPVVDNTGTAHYSINFGAQSPDQPKHKSPVINPETDPWLADSFIGVKPKPDVDVFERVDFRDYDFKRFARDNYRKPQQVVRQSHTDLKYGSRISTIGTSPDNDDDFK